MNAHERVMNTLQGRPTDRVPVFAVLGAYGGKLTHTDLRTLYSDARAYVAGQRAVQDTFGLDLVLATFDYSALAEAFGGEVAWFEDQAPNMKRPGARDAAAAMALPLPDPYRTARLPVILEATRQLAGLYQGRVPLFAAVPGPGALPSMVLGLETWLETVLFDEPAASRMLEWSGRFFVAWANALLEAGATGLVVTESVASAEISPRRLFAERFMPHVRTMFARVRGPLVFHHGGGRIGSVLDLLPGVPGLVGVVVSSKDDLGAARQALGPEPLLIGNLDNLSLPTATAAEIRARSLACLQAAAPAGRYILSHSAADVPLSAPPENLRAMIAASEEYARNPHALP
jgi:uroporphyrinogen decarboxylase